MKIRKKHEWNGEPRKIDWGQVKSVSYIFPKGSLEDDWREEALRHREEILQLKDQLQQKENIIKEVREYIKTKMEIRKNCENVYSYDIRNDDYIKQVDKLLEILDKVD